MLRFFAHILSGSSSLHAIDALKFSRLKCQFPKKTTTKNEKKEAKKEGPSYPYSIKPKKKPPTDFFLSAVSEPKAGPATHHGPLTTLNTAFAPAFLPPYPAAMVPPESNPARHPRRPRGPRHTVRSRTGERGSRCRGRFPPRRNCATVYIRMSRTVFGLDGTEARSPSCQHYHEQSAGKKGK